MILVCLFSSSSFFLSSIWFWGEVVVYVWLLEDC